MNKWSLRALTLLAIFILGTWLLLARPFAFSFGERVEVVSADAARLEVQTRKISAEFFPRDWRHVENLDRLADYVDQQFAQSAAVVRRQRYTVGGQNYQNVIAEYGSAGASGMLVIGAHYDTCSELPGADDNASGVAGILELGRMLAKKTLPFQVELVAYSLEEPPFFGTAQMGSAVHAASLVAAHQKVDLMISLEMIGYFSDEPGSQSYPLPLLNLLYPTRGNFIAAVGNLSLSPATIELKKAFLKAVPLRMVSINAPSFIPGIDFSDHRNYWTRGFDAVMITDTAFFRNHAYHKEQDTPERLDYRRMAQVVTGIYSFVIARGGAGSS